MNMIFGPINSLGKIFIEFALPMLVQSSIVIGILLLAERLLRDKVRAVFRYWLGILIFVQLILPPLLISRVNLGYLSVAGDVSQSAASPVITWQGTVFLVWLAVVIVMGLLLLKRVILAGRHIRQAKRANFLMNDLLAYCCKCMGVNNKKVRLRISSDGTSPAVYGLFRPVILVPNNLAPSLGSRHLRAVLLHELAHIKRGDLWVNWAQTVLQIVYFYNPLLWLANSTICRVREQAVDEVVLAAMGKKMQRYPEMLADVARLMFKRPALSLGLIGVVESQDTLANWIKSNLYPLLRKSA
jgi:beta-lactamase regulating signal transducer with metallopeptidase domain